MKLFVFGLGFSAGYFAKRRQAHGDSVAGTGGIIPRMIAVSPPNEMNLDFKIGVSRALGGAEAYVAWSNEPPAGGILANATLHGPMTREGAGAGEGVGTWKFRAS